MCIVSSRLTDALNGFIVSKGRVFSNQKRFGFLNPLRAGTSLRVIFLENRESEDTHKKSVFLLFHQNIPLRELI